MITEIDKIKGMLHFDYFHVKFNENLIHKLQIYLKINQRGQN